MLYLDLHRLFNQKGIDNPVGYLYKNGFTRHTAHRLVHNEASTLNFRHLERLCVLLNCEPNDLLAWQPDAKTAQQKEHPLQKLKRTTTPYNITHDLQKLPPRQLEQVRRFIHDLGQTPPPEE